MNKIAFAIATCCGLGRLPGAPGTYGSLATLPPAYLLLHLGNIAFFIICAAVVIIGTWASHRHAANLPDSDPQEIIIDEVAGQMLALAAIAVGFADLNVFWVATAFVLFRAFDILKPFPIGWLDKNIHGGVGIMADDIAAGIIAFVVLAGLGIIL